jgi:proteasome accessory factor A
LVRDDKSGTPEKVVEEVKNHCFYQKKWGLIDLHARDYSFEPARSGGFLINGGRLYIDAVGDHEEYATPECTDIFDACRYYKAGQWIVQGLLNDLGVAEVASFHNNSVDHYGGHTFGCHENYLVEMQDEDFFRASFNYLLPFCDAADLRGRRARRRAQTELFVHEELGDDHLRLRRGLPVGEQLLRRRD